MNTERIKRRFGTQFCEPCFSIINTQTLFECFFCKKNNGSSITVISAVVDSNSITRSVECCDFCRSELLMFKCGQENCTTNLRIDSFPETLPIILSKQCCKEELFFSKSHIDWFYSSFLVHPDTGRNNYCWDFNLKNIQIQNKDIIWNPYIIYEQLLNLIFFGIETNMIADEEFKYFIDKNYSQNPQENKKLNINRSYIYHGIKNDIRHDIRHSVLQSFIWNSTFENESNTTSQAIPTIFNYLIEKGIFLIDLNFFEYLTKHNIENGLYKFHLISDPKQLFATFGKAWVNPLLNSPEFQEDSCRGFIENVIIQFSLRFIDFEFFSIRNLSKEENRQRNKMANRFFHQTIFQLTWSQKRLLWISYFKKNGILSSLPKDMIRLIADFLFVKITNNTILFEFDVKQDISNFKKEIKYIQKYIK